MTQEKELDCEVIYLVDHKDLSNKKVEATMTPEHICTPIFGIFKQDPKQPYKYEFDDLQFINVNKVFKETPDSVVFKDYENHLDILRKRYFNKLPTLNRKLLDKTKKILPNKNNVDLIIIPESSNDKLRFGLLELFSGFYGAEVKIAKKKKQVQSSGKNNPELKFLFVEKIYQDSYKNIVIIDDCICSGQTVSRIREAVERQGLSVDKYYCCVYFRDEVTRNSDLLG